MRPKTPRNIKIKVIDLYINGDRIEEIAKKLDIGKGTVSAIIKEAKEQKEYYDIDWLRQVSVMLRQEGLPLYLLGFATRINNIMNENGIDEDQLEITISDFATYCFRNDLTYERLIECGQKALELADKFGITVELLPDYLTQGVEKLELLGEQQNQMLNTMLNAQKDLDLTLAEQERYGGEKPLIDRIKEQEEELKEVRTSEQYYKKRFESAERRWVEESNMASRIHDDNMILNHRLVELQDELDKTKEETGWRGHCRVNEDEETS